MNRERTYRTDVVVAGGGLAGIVAAYELLGSGRRRHLVDKSSRERFGGLAEESSGGLLPRSTRHSNGGLGIQDSPELAWSDWQKVAQYEPADFWPRAWGKCFCEQSAEHVFEFLRAMRVDFLPVVGWAERGMHGAGNSVPRWHVVWGMGPGIVRRLVDALQSHPRAANLEILFDTEISGSRSPPAASTAFVARRWAVAASSGSRPTTW